MDIRKELKKSFNEFIPTYNAVEQIMESPSFREYNHCTR